jgi:hypothetical protein
LCGCGAKEPDPTGISLEEFNKISTGMYLSTVKEIIGGDGTIVSDEDKSTDDYYEKVTVYRFNGETTGYAELEFTYHKDHDSLSYSKLGELTSKTQYDLS